MSRAPRSGRQKRGQVQHFTIHYMDHAEFAVAAAPSLLLQFLVSVCLACLLLSLFIWARCLSIFACCIVAAPGTGGLKSLRDCLC